MQPSLRQVRRFFLYGLLTFFAVIVSLAGALRVETYVRRGRSEQLLSDILSIQLRRTTFEQADAISARWHGTAEMPCSRQHCDMRISLPAVIFSNPNFLWSHPKILQLVLSVYRLLGGRPGGTGAEINVRNGLVWGEYYGMGFERITYEGNARQNTWLEGEIRADPYHVDFRDIRQARHSEYAFRGTSRCPECEIWVRFTPYADARDIRRLAQFNFSCMTRLHPCRTIDDLMPVATSQAREEYADPMVNRPLKCDLKSVELLARESENAATAEVVSNRASSQTYSDSRIFRLHLIERLKGTLVWRTGALADLDAYDASALPPIDGLTNVGSGDRVIVLFGASDPTGIIAGACGMVPYSLENLATVRAGIAEDERVPPLREYDPNFHPGKYSDLPTTPPFPKPAWAPLMTFASN
jgi:hypothetical protein